MAILISINGNSHSGGFLIAPKGATKFPVAVTLRTNDGTTVNARLRFSSNGAGAVLSSTTVQISPVNKIVKIHATRVSAAIKDTVLEVLVGGVVKATFKLTGISNPQVWFKGRFQARFATDPDLYNDPKGTNGIMFVLEGEPDFVPAANNVPLADGQFVGRVIKFSNPEVIRSHMAPVGVKVYAVKAIVGGLLRAFTVGDPIIGMEVNLGSGSYFASNTSAVPPLPFEQYPAGLEAIGNFEFNIGHVFSGKSNFTSPANNNRPKANGIANFTTADLTKFGMTVIDLNTFNATRKSLLQNDFNALTPAARTGTANGRNLSVRLTKINQVIRYSYDGMETYNGLINDSITINAANSCVMKCYSKFNSFNFNCSFLNFHRDDMCGQVGGIVTPV